MDAETGLYAKLSAVRTRAIEQVGRIQQMRDALSQWKVGDEMRLHGELQAVHGQQIESEGRQHAATQDVRRGDTSQYDKLFSQIQQSTGMILGGKEKHVAQTMANSQFLTEVRHRLCAKKMEADLHRVQGRLTVDDKQQELVRYMVSTRNDLLIGFFGFVERRTDEGPSLTDIAQLATNLGDSGSTSWVSP